MADAAKKSNAVGGLVLLAIIMVGVLWFLHLGGSDNSGQSTKSQATFTAGLADNCPMNYDQSCWGEGGSVSPVNPADLRVYVKVTNTSRVSGTPICTINAEDAGYNDKGVDVVERNSPLNAGGEWDFSDDLTITKQGSQYVTQMSIKCDNG